MRIVYNAFNGRYADSPAALHRALDLAGVPAEGRTLHFQVGSPEPAPAPAPAPQPGPSGGGMGGGMGDPGNGGSQPGTGHNQPRGWSGLAAQGTGQVAAGPRHASRSPHGLRAGVDITA